ncbi:hypothetical protein [Pseudotabrizicola formosa]|uniref:hypothetical protein n=1 Tax=Pseudotabrizicola formosa TaxID=2030009 RepID=UPI00143E09A7|nr:hypothetical protein [Pseudotabrizicola formosa]
MIPGLGLVRRSITLALCGAAFWAGMNVSRIQSQTACLDAGGSFDPRGFCSTGVSLP